MKDISLEDMLLVAQFTHRKNGTVWYIVGARIARDNFPMVVEDNWRANFDIRNGDDWKETVIELARVGCHLEVIVSEDDYEVWGYRYGKHASSGHYGMQSSEEAIIAAVKALKCNGTWR